MRIRFSVWSVCGYAHVFIRAVLNSAGEVGLTLTVKLPATPVEFSVADLYCLPLSLSLSPRVWVEFGLG